MIVDPQHVLQPLEAAEPAIRATGEHASTEALEHALRSAAAALDESLRRLLHADAGAPEDLRRAARSPEALPFDRLLDRLRERGLISLELAGLAHSLRRAVSRAEREVARPEDAALARRAVDRLRDEVAAVEAEAAAALPGRAARASHPAPTVHPVPPPRRGRRRLAAAVIAVAVLLAASAVTVVLLLRGPDVGEPLAAFRAGRLDEAESGFRQVVEEQPDNVTARLYLARIHRMRGNVAAASTELRAAVRAAPADADVRRELGYLFLDLDRPGPAVEQLERAVELEPEEPMNWIGLVRALRVADDPRAERVLRRAPAEVRALLAETE